jgi:hypothetical protein
MVDMLMTSVPMSSSRNMQICRNSLHLQTTINATCASIGFEIVRFSVLFGRGSRTEGVKEAVKETAGAARLCDSLTSSKRCCVFFESCGLAYVKESAIPAEGFAEI